MDAAFPTITGAIRELLADWRDARTRRIKKNAILAVSKQLAAMDYDELWNSLQVSPPINKNGYYVKPKQLRTFVMEPTGGPPVATITVGDSSITITEEQLSLLRLMLPRLLWSYHKPGLDMDAIKARLAAGEDLHDVLPMEIQLETGIA
jgi:hypothetical protein